MRVLFLINEYSLHNHILESYLKARPSDQVSVVKVRLVLRGKSRLASAEKILPQLSKRFIVGKFLEACCVLAITAIPKILSRGAVFKRLSSICTSNKLPFHTTDNVADPETMNFVRTQNPDLIISLFHQIIRQELIAIPKLGIINIHPGLLPEYKGIQPYFWELSEKSPSAGVSIHFIEDEKVDTGSLLATAKYSTEGVNSVHLNYYLTSKVAATILPEVVTLLEDNKLEPKAQDTSQGKYFRWPDEEAFDRLQHNERCLFSWRDLYEILEGRYDDFRALETWLATKKS